MCCCAGQTHTLHDSVRLSFTPFVNQESGSKVCIFFLCLSGGSKRSASLLQPIASSDMGNKWSSDQLARRIAVPLYLWPGYGSKPCAWERLLASPAANPVVIVNPDSGPGREAFNLFSVAIAKCQGVGIKVLGYVRTEYAKRDLSLVIRDLELYSCWYKVDGFFIDEMYHWGEPLLAHNTNVVLCPES